MGNYPWGSHGPQSGPNQVTPNPTPAYGAPPPNPTPAYYPTSTPSYGGGPVPYGGAGASYTGPILPRRKGYFMALILTFLFGPLGLFYATKRGALAMLLFLVGVPVALSAAGALPFGSSSHPFAGLDHSSVIDGLGSVSAFFSMLWSLVAVN